MAVLTVDYRRPPEHRFPAAPDDVDTAVHWLVANAAGFGIDPTRLAVIGDSAGGNLALVAALRNPHLFAGAVLVYPFLDPEAAAPSYATESLPSLTAEECEWYWGHRGARTGSARSRRRSSRSPSTPCSPARPSSSPGSSRRPAGR